MEELRKNFEKFYESLKTSPDPETLKEAFWVTYLQGHNDRTPQKEVPIEQVVKDVDDECFFDFVKSCVEEKLPAGMDPAKATDYVEVEYPTCEDDPDCAGCANDPDDCESVHRILKSRGKKLINISKLCGADPASTIFVKNKELLTHEEAAAISSALAEYMKEPRG